MFKLDCGVRIMLIAIKTQDLNPDNTFNVPDYWPWQKMDIRLNERAQYESDGWTVYTVAEYEAYLLNNKAKLTSHYLSQISTTPKYLDVSIDIKKAFAQIPKILGGNEAGVQVEKDYCFVETEEQFQQYKQQIEDAPIIVADIETTSVSPRTGSILGIAISTKPHQG